MPKCKFKSNTKTDILSGFSVGRRNGTQHLHQACSCGNVHVSDETVHMLILIGTSVLQNLHGYDKRNVIFLLRVYRLN